MTPEEKSLLERTHKLAEENNEILHSIRRTNRFAVIARVVYWVVILLIGFGAFYFIQPYFTALMGATGQTETGWSGFVDTLKQGQSAAEQLKDLYK
jgi:hypothetical protein